ncbi:Rne/Rng family ribonuclease [Albirhodobacter sp. R86504]|uniref:Rne/Rng family ribonuclease n=1 Tax=Albirhodobacter sp. R86504 TaxID=3093848 RepID=UPI00366ED287
MAKKMLIDATHAEETRVVVVDGNKVEEFDFETVNRRQLAGNIYLAKVTRVEPSLQAAFVDYGGNRHGFLAFAEIHPDYYQIPMADRQALLEEERAAAAEADEAEEKPRQSSSNGGRRRRSRGRSEKAQDTDAVVRSEDIPGMGVVDEAVTDEAAADDAVADQPVAEGVATPDASTPEVSTDEAPSEAVAETVADDTTAETPAEQDQPEENSDDGASEDESDEDESDDEDDRQARGNARRASEEDDIESVADDDVAEEIRAPRKPRARRYKIQEVIKMRQIMLVQVVKEERGNKGAALTTYLSLAGRYCVLMPNTARGGGISRKITNAPDRKKLKEIASEMEVPQGAGLIIRTAGSQRTRTEIRRDYEYLMRLWEQIRELTLKSVAPAPIYEEGDLIKRSIRDLYSKEIDEVLVEGERGYRLAKDFMRMIMPTHANQVVNYKEQMPLFARFQVESYLGAMFNPVVQLKSGGYIVIGITEALVAIDVNSGRATKEGSIEETALKTNLEAAEEVARQLRLRDLAGLIVIDFIDMEERKNNAAVEKRMKDKLKTDRARIQVGRISGFGLMEMSRQRLRPGMLESTTQPCSHCHGTGLIRSDDNIALQVLRAIEEEGTRKRSREVLVRAPIAVANYLMNAKREHIAVIEARYGMAVRIEADPHLISPDYSMEKFKTQTRNIAELVTSAVSVDANLMAEIDNKDDEAFAAAVAAEEAAEAADAAAEAAATVTAVEPVSEEDGDQPRKKKRRRRRKKKTGDRAEDGSDESESDDSDDGDESDDLAEDAARAAAAAELAAVAIVTTEVATEAPVDTPAEAVTEKPKRAPRSRAKKVEPVEGEAEVEKPKRAPRSRAKKVVAAEGDAEATVEAAPEKPKRAPRSRAKKAVAAELPEVVAEAPAPQGETPNEAPAEAPVEIPTPAPVEAPTPTPVEVPVSEAPVEVPAQEPEATTPVSDAPTEEPKPKKRGWWSLNR